jgi:hypothetical protein
MQHEYEYNPKGAQIEFHRGISRKLRVLIQTQEEMHLIFI